MSDRRDNDRHQFIFHARVLNADNDRFLGHLVDLSHNGLMVATEEPLSIGQSYRLSVQLPIACNGLRTLTTTVVVAWSEPAAHPLYQRNGLNAQELDEQQRGALQELIAGYRAG